MVPIFTYYDFSGREIHPNAAPRTDDYLRTEFLTGSAGTGKTHAVQQRRAAEPDGVILAATTGIAAVNLGPEITTINSLLGFFDHNTLQRSSRTGALMRRIGHLIRGGMRELVIDEISMLSAPSLDLIFNAAYEAARLEDQPITLTLVGDFCQLPPIPDRDTPGTERYPFESECWRPHFSEHTTRLTTIWRQDHEEFVLALQAARRGEGNEALAHLQRSGVRFAARLNDAFEGTTLCATNDAVDAYNMRRLRQLAGEDDIVAVIRPVRWSLDGHEPSEWRWIPNPLCFRIGAYVMILSNGGGAVNGDCGTVVGGGPEDVIVRLRRNNQDVTIRKIIRTHTTRSAPVLRDADIIEVHNQAEYDQMVRDTGEPPRQVVMLREPHPVWITGWIKYCPLRLAYATTVHKSQGLSLDSLQLDLSSGFLGQSAMMYVALSRCRTPGGLVLVGTPEQLVARTNVDPRVTPYL